MSDAHRINAIPRWKFWVRVVGVLGAIYLVGYFAVVNRHRPTSPSNADGYFQSSFRWADDEWIQHPAMPGPQHTPYPEVSIFNIIYEPMDWLYFRFLPRSQSEVERLRELGYYR
jgi:hypothetical protein